MTNTSRRTAGGASSQPRRAQPIGPRYRSRFSSTDATHSSTPILGWSGGGWGVSSSATSDLVHVGLAEDAGRPDDDDHDQQREDVEVLERRALRQIARRVRLREADDQSAEHRAGDAPDPPDHGRREALEAGQEAHEVVALAEDETEHHAGRA